jgi:hypothetical protein
MEIRRFSVNGTEVILTIGETEQPSYDTFGWLHSGTSSIFTIWQLEFGLGFTVQFLNGKDG